MSLQEVRHMQHFSKYFHMALIYNAYPLTVQRHYYFP